MDAQVPSLHDSHNISCKLYINLDRKPSGSSNLAVVAHPYGPLGGSKDDPVVLLTVQSLMESGYDVVATFDFRKRPSWTLKPEIDDFCSVVLFTLFYESLIHYEKAAKSSAIWPCSILIGGYSYGSLVASYVPPARDLLRITDKKWARCEDIRDAALTLASHTSSTTEIVPVDTLASRLWTANTCYLFISPLLSPTTLYLAPLAARKDKAKEQLRYQNHRSLAVFGTKDTFTSSQRLSAHFEDVGVETVVVDQASHFWHEQSSSSQLKAAIENWVTTMPTSRGTAEGSSES